jgi:nucleoid DNA-binding protein
MPNRDFPEICFAVSDEECRITPPDLDVVRERVHKLPSGYTKTLVRSLQAAFPDKLQSEEDAYMIFDAVKAVIANGLHNGDTVDLEGLGVFRQEKEGGQPKVVFYPNEKLHDIASR